MVPVPSVLLVRRRPEADPPPPLQLLPRGQHEERGDRHRGRHDEEKHGGSVMGKCRSLENGLEMIC